MTTKNIEEQKKYEYWLYQTNPLRRSRMIRMTERGLSPKDLYERGRTEEAVAVYLPKWAGKCDGKRYCPYFRKPQDI